MRTTTYPITIKNVTNIQKALDEVQQGKRSFLLTAADIVRATQEAEKRLAAFSIPVQQRKDFTFTFDPHSVANAYRYAGACTVAELRRNSSGWTVTKIRRNLGIKHGSAASEPMLRLCTSAERREDIYQSAQFRSRIQISTEGEVA